MRFSIKFSSLPIRPFISSICSALVLFHDFSSVRPIFPRAPLSDSLAFIIVIELTSYIAVLTSLTLRPRAIAPHLPAI